jgi:uncharacterized alpha-E superfamily protein
VLSRVANSIYWMSRYLERADNVARFINVNVHLSLDLGADDTAQWQPLVVASGDAADFARRYGKPSEKNVLRFLTFDGKNPNSILSCINYARENARTVREAIPSDMWEKINELYHLVHKHSRKQRVTDLQEFYTHIRMCTHLFTGLLEDGMSREEGWHFARLGKMIERADKTARFLDVKYFLLLPTPEYVDSPYDAVQWGAVLKSANAFEMYRKQFHRINYKDVAQFLIFDPLFPRSIMHCVQTAERSLAAICAAIGASSPAVKEMATLQNMLAGATIDAILTAGLHEFIDVFQLNLNVVDQSIFTSFFARS